MPAINRKIVIMKIIGLTCLLIVFLSCEKIEKNTRIQTRGSVIDTVKLCAITDSKVIIHGLLYYGIYGKGGNPIDTILTTNGSFSIDFLADGNYYGYALSVLNTENIYFIPSAELKEIEPNTIHYGDLFARELHCLKAHLKISNSTSDSLQVTAQYGYIHNKLVGHNFDTTLYFKVLPDTINKLSFYNYDRMIHFETIAVDLSDTLLFSKSYDFK